MIFRSLISIVAFVIIARTAEVLWEKHPLIVFIMLLIVMGLIFVFVR